jgi:type I restriction enzyme S subunit
MIDNWRRVKLADVCTSIDYGYTTSASAIPVGPKFLRITDIVPGHISWNDVPFCTIDTASKQRFQLHQGDVVIARTGATTGVSAYIANPPDAVFASYLVRIKVVGQCHISNGRGIRLRQASHET